jgi:hypothetical protein
MKKCLPVLLFISLFCGLNGSIKIDNDLSVLTIEGRFDLLETNTEIRETDEFVAYDIQQCYPTGGSEIFELPVYSETVSLPDNGNFRLSNFEYEYEEYDLEEFRIKTYSEDNDTVYSRDEWLPRNLVKIGDPAIMRGYRLANVSITPIQYNPAQNKIKMLTNFRAEFVLDQTISKNPLSRSPRPSTAFRNFVENPKRAQPAYEDYRGAYLFITPDLGYEHIRILANWKQQLGYHTTIAVLSETGDTNNEIKDYIQDAYDNWEIPPEYVVLVGDVSGTMQLPTFFVEGGFNRMICTDLPYTLLDGDDFLPDVLLGRLSVQNLTQLSTVINKLISYEKDPPWGDWFSSALMISYVAPYYNIYSHRETVMSIRDKLLQNEYVKVDTFTVPYQNSASIISNFVNQGLSLINVRTTGGPNNWSSMAGGTMYDINDVNNLNNGSKLPFVTAITCGGGDFANPNVPHSIGETWLIAGTPSNPKGGIGFIGSSEFNTQTRFNNAISTGIYQGFLYEDLTKGGEMMLRGKMELYNNYPYNHAWGTPVNSIQHYFYSYGLLGDPGLTVWRKTPRKITLSAPDTLFVGANFIPVSVDSADGELSGFTIALTNDDSLHTVSYTDESGEAKLYSQLPSGTYQITASRHQHIPQIKTVEIIQGNLVGVESHDLEEDLAPDEFYEIEITFKNYGEDNAEDITISVYSHDNYLNLIDDEAVISKLRPGETGSAVFSFETGKAWNNGYNHELIVDISSNFGTNESTVLMSSIAAELIFSELQFTNTQNALLQNQINDVYLGLLNMGTLPTGDFSIRMTSINDRATVHNSTVNYNTIPAGETGYSETTFSIEVDNVISGLPAMFLLEVIIDDNVVFYTEFQYPIGIINQQSPTLSEYGYYAIECRDENSLNPVQYNWIEINPLYGGDGIELGVDYSTSDGYTSLIELPFEFQFYGNYYYSISVSSNGWIGMGQQLRVFHRNRIIPSGDGPHGMIAPYWDDMHDGSIHYKYDDVNNYFIIQWTNWRSVYDNSSQTFQVILYDPEHYPTSTGDGNILFQYKEIHNTNHENNFATIGLENEHNTQGLMITFADLYPPTAHPIQSETAIFFSIAEGEQVPYMISETEELSVTLPPDSSSTKYITITNPTSKDLPYTLEFKHFVRGRNKPVRDISDDLIVAGGSMFTPVIPTTLLFYLIHNSTEPVYGVKMDFPDGFVIHNATDIQQLPYNGESGDGEELSWGFIAGTTIEPTSPAGFNVDVTIDASHTEPVDIEWEIHGDGSGELPHMISGTITLNPTNQDHIWIHSPTNDDVLVCGTQESLIWDYFGDFDTVDTDISYTGGTSWEEFESQVPNTGTYEFTVPYTLTERGKFRLRAGTGSTQASTNGLFRITALDIVYPDENTIMSFDKPDSVEWKHLGDIETVSLHLSTNNGVDWQPLAIDIPNNGHYEFIVGGTPSEYSRIKVSSIHGIEQISKPFTIVDSPVNWIGCENHEGMLSAEETKTIPITINSKDLSGGIYSAYAIFRSHIGQIIYIPVELTVEATNIIPEVHNLYQNFPNPFNTTTNIAFDLPHESNVSLKIYNIRGKLIKTLLDEILSPQHHLIVWDGTDNKGRSVSSGVYLYKLETNNFEKAKKMLYLK